MELNHQKLKIIFIGGLVLLIILLALFFLNIFSSINKSDIAGKAINDVCVNDADCGSADLVCKNNLCSEKIIILQTFASCIVNNEVSVIFKEQNDIESQTYTNECTGDYKNFRKYSCDKNQLVMEIYRCSNGCSNGACV